MPRPDSFLVASDAGGGGHRHHDAHAARTRGALAGEDSLAASKATWSTSLRDAGVTAREQVAFRAGSSLRDRHGRRHHVPKKRLEAVRNKLRAAAYLNTKGQDFEGEFKQMDKNKDGVVSRGEFLYTVRRLVRLSEEDAEDLVRHLDADGNGTIDLDEFLAFVTGFTAGSVLLSAVVVVHRRGPSARGDVVLSFLVSIRL